MTFGSSGYRDKTLYIQLTTVMSDREYTAFKEAQETLREEEERAAWSTKIDTVCAPAAKEEDEEVTTKQLAKKKYKKGSKRR